MKETKVIQLFNFLLELSLQVELDRVQFLDDSVSKIAAQSDVKYRDFLNRLLNEAREGNLEALHDLEIELDRRQILQDWSEPSGSGLINSIHIKQ